MQIRVITLPWDAENQAFNEQNLLEATSGKDVLDYESRWTVVDGRDCLVLTLKLTSGGNAAAVAGRAGRSSNAPNDPRRQKAMEFIRKLEEQMPEATKAVYFKLKDWRIEKVKGTGAPVFSIANNRQLAELALKAPKTLTEIREIRGLGQQFLKAYGEEALAMVKDLAPTAYELPDDGKDEGAEKPEEGSSMITEASK